jgi:hypothetical protein
MSPDLRFDPVAHKLKQEAERSADDIDFAALAVRFGEYLYQRPYQPLDQPSLPFAK